MKQLTLSSCILLGLLSLAATGPAAAADDPPAPETTSAPEAASQPPGIAELLAAMDRKADPCQDFYRYACGGWIDSTELPADQSRWARSFSTIHERNREIVRDLLEDAAESPGPAGTDRWRIGTFYASCTDEEARENAGAEPLARLLAEIERVRDPASLLAVAGKLERYNVDSLFGARVMPDFKNPGVNIASFLQGGLSLPDRDYYVSQDEKKRQLLAAYERHVARMLQLLGDQAESAAEQAARVVAFETRLAEASRPRSEMRIPEKLYHKIDLAGLQELTPELPWKSYLAAIGHPDITDINVATPEFFEALEAAVTAAEPATLTAYLRWRLVHETAGELSSPFVEEDFAFYGATLQGQKENQPLWKRCVAATERALGEAIGRLYVEHQFPGDSKKVALQMIGDIEAAFEQSLPRLGWMDEKTRERALEKVGTLGNKIGYPGQWRDYSAIQLRPGRFFDNALAAAEFEFDRQASKVGKPVDRSEWRMTPQTVNAYYNPLLNEIAFPAGILQPPFFRRDFPPALNYGGIGAVVGHELTHGFDDQGRKFDPSGQLREWWEPQVSEKFEARAQCVRDLYSTYEVEPGLHVQGELTAGENIADIGGLKQALRAFELWRKRQEGEVESPVEGLSNEQLFFIAYGQVWCSLATPEVERVRVTVDPHSPPRFRVIGAVSNNPAFGEAFGCEPGTPMQPKNPCEVW